MSEVVDVAKELENKFGLGRGLALFRGVVAQDPEAKPMKITTAGGTMDNNFCRISKSLNFRMR